MTPHDSDPDFDAFLRENEDLIARYHALPQVEPGKHLDAAVLGKAMNVHRKPERRSPWLVPLASAATLAVAGGIGWKVHQFSNQQAVNSTWPAGQERQVLEIELHNDRDALRQLETAQHPPMPARDSAASGMPMEGAKRERLQDILGEPVSAPAAAPPPGIEPHTAPDHTQLGRVTEQKQQVLSDAYLRKENESDSIELRGSRDAAKSINELNAPMDAASGEAEKEIAEPREWILHMRRLLRERRYNALREQIREFRLHYPSYQLPSEFSRYER
jgi:hypothetical protein